MSKLPKSYLIHILNCVPLLLFTLESRCGASDGSCTSSLSPHSDSQGPSMSGDISSAMSPSMANADKVIGHKSINFPHLFPFSATGTRSMGTRQIEFRDSGITRHKDVHCKAGRKKKWNRNEPLIWRKTFISKWLCSNVTIFQYYYLMVSTVIRPHGEWLSMFNLVEISFRSQTHLAHLLAHNPYVMQLGI